MSAEKTNQCTNYGGEIKSIFLIKDTDIKTLAPKLELKRKYGKFKREIIRVQ